MISFLLCYDQRSLWQSHFIFTEKTHFPSFLPCVQCVCFCFAATGSTSLLSQAGLCRFYFFSVIPQTHLLTGITKNNDDFWFLNKKKTKQIQLSGSNITESSVFLPLCSVCESNHYWLSTSPASQPRFISCKLLCARSDSDIWRVKIVR